MKIIGLIGGISWVSTVDYYRFINEGINQQLGGINFANCVIYSFNYQDIIRNNESGNWADTLDKFTVACEGLKQCGATAIVLCANTMHKIAAELEQRIGIPVIHIATATANAITKQNLKKVGLLGTRFTMEMDFFKDKLHEQNIEAIIPGDEDRLYIHTTLHSELSKGITLPETKRRYLEIIDRLIARGAEGIILGCTEIPLLINQDDVSVPVFDTTRIHSAAAVAYALS
ncbi:aspartate/glutamate racemase family protein [Mucilaginibacter mali]|uniref:Aspartate/glutamate racemase family protein n=1 Tax=Mucilaginibacter mali TaxID=2740462 RepID=A0A7D4PTB6_9SPHI|nr:aspartate/glutamate racemase family protein [Mucilaginibacter mali]QKJ29828.1 aspartate/glutamate racemase family protein [Mucilaginibacter mali]